jgi:hypothetical protein
MCRVCKHPHYPDEKCPICGHRGKAKSHKRYENVCKSTGPTPTELHFKIFDSSSKTSSETRKKLWALAKIMREHVFVKELLVNHDAEFDNVEGASRHVISFIGDAPISYTRWRVVQEGGSVFAMLERWCTLTRHRRNGYGKRTMVCAVQDIVRHQSSLSAIVTNCPNNSPTGRSFVESMGFKRVGQPHETPRGVFQRYILSRPFR